MLKNDTGYDFTWFDGNTRKNSSLGSSVIGTKAADSVIKAVINGGNTFTSTNTQVAGKPYFVAYVPVKDDSGKVVAMAFTGMSRESVNAQISKSIIFMLVISLILLVICVGVGVKASGGMAGGIVAINESVEHLANGEFIKATKYLERTDEIGICLNNTNYLVDKLQEIVSEIRSFAGTVTTSSEELSDMATTIAHTAEDVSNAVQEIASGATQQADEIKKEMEVLLEESNAAVLAAEEVRQGNIDQQTALGETIESINGMLYDIDSTVGGVQTISQGAEQCATSKDAVVDTMSALSAISKENAASSQETGASMQELSATVTTLAASAGDLKEVAERLNKDMEFFK